MTTPKVLALVAACVCGYSFYWLNGDVTWSFLKFLFSDKIVNQCALSFILVVIGIQLLDYATDPYR